LVPKIRSTLILDEITQDLVLDFFVLFSSIASFGSAGQLDYATGNAFLDVFAEHRNRLVAEGKRHGKSLSINWPLWKEGGMSPGKAYEDLLFDKQGMRPLPTKRGLDAFEIALGLAKSQIGLAVGVKEKILKALKAGEPGKDAGPQKIVPGADFRQVVRDGVAKIFLMEPSKVDLGVTFIEYGADSIMLTEFANLLNSYYATDYAGSAFLELDCGDRVVEHLEERFGAAKAHSPARSSTSPTEDGTHAPVPTPFCLSPVAIIGFDGSFPDAPDLETFWENIAAKHLSVRELDRNHWKQRGVNLNGHAGALESSMKWAALMNGVDEFDASFWGIDKEAARQMDPQLRLLLKSVWHCIEGAGYAVESLAEKKVGVFIAADSVDYLSILNARKQAATVESGLSLGMLANRLSYYLNFHGASESIDTACSSVYAALNRAVQAIRCGQCEIAVVGAAKVLLDPAGFEIREKGNLLSESGRTCSFDAAADGYVRGEGVGCLLLKALPQWPESTFLTTDAKDCRRLHRMSRDNAGRCVPPIGTPELIPRQ
jgi:polyketide synthase PksN